MTLKDKIIIYLYNKMNKIETDRAEVKRTMRYRPADSFDMYEATYEFIRCEVWDELILDLYNIVFNTMYKE